MKFECQKDRLSINKTKIKRKGIDINIYNAFTNATGGRLKQIT